MIDKRFQSLAQAVSDIGDGASVMVGGFGQAGSPVELIHALIDCGASELTIISNNAGSGRVGLAALIGRGQVAKIICSFPRMADSSAFSDAYGAGKIALELVPQGTLAERIRAGGAGIAAFYTPTSVGTPLAEGKEMRDFGGRSYVLEHGLRADFALVKAQTADRYGNLLYRKTARNFNPVMAAAAATTIVQTSTYVAVGEIDPETIVTPGIYVNRIVHVASAEHESVLVAEGRAYP